MTIDLGKLAAWFVLLLIFVSPYSGIEVRYMLCILALLFQRYSDLKLRTSYWLLNFFLLAIVFIGCISGAFHFNTYDKVEYIKDIGYHSLPILMLTAGYFAVNSKKELLKYLLKHIVIISTIIAFLHITYSLSYIVLHPQNNAYYIRQSIFGLGNHIEVVALALTLIKTKNSLLYISLHRKIIYQVILLLSIILYISRIDILMLAIFVVCLLGWLNFSYKILFRLFILIIIIILIILIISNIETTDSSKGFLSFIHKFKNSFQEIYNFDIDLNNKADLWKKWRAYEAKMAITQTLDKGPFTFLFGNGFGGLIDIKIQVFLGDRYFRYIPNIHNGYVQTFFKTGIMGLLCSFIITYLIINPFTAIKDMSLNNFKKALGLIFFVTLLVIGGIYSGYPEQMIIIGIIYGIRKRYESWNNWN